MDIPLKTLDLQSIKKDLVIGIQECSQRGLNHSAKWLAELNHSISHIKLKPEDIPSTSIETDNESEAYLMAKTYFDTKEYDRSAYFTKDCVSSRARFLHLYSKYVSSEKKKIDSMTDANCPPDPTRNGPLKELSSILKKDHQNNVLDGYGLYLYGVTLKKLDLHPLAIDIFIEAIHAAPIHWGAWLELSPLISDPEQLKTIKLPDHWIKPFFMAHSYLEQLCNEEALEIYYHLTDQGFQESNYLLAQTAIVHHNRRGNKFC